MGEGDPKMAQMSDEDIKELRDLITSVGNDEDMPPGEAIGRMEHLRTEIRRLPASFKQYFEVMAQYQQTRTKVLERYRKWIDGEIDGPPAE